MRRSRNPRSCHRCARASAAYYCADTTAVEGIACKSQGTVEAGRVVTLRVDEGKAKLHIWEYAVRNLVGLVINLVNSLKDGTTRRGIDTSMR
eukprot:29996-Prymnesium_polylepis.1